MTKPGDKDWLSHEEYLRRAPKKRISGAAIFLDETDRIMIVKPTYKDYWLLPGGAVEKFESPRQACIREVQEELGLTIQKPPLIAVIHVARPDKQDESIYFHFFGGYLKPQDIESIHLQKDELSEYRFVHQAEAVGLAMPGFIEKMPAIISAIANKNVAYFEEVEGAE